MRCVSISGIFVYSTCYRWIHRAVAPETEQGYRCPLWCPNRNSAAQDGPDKWIEEVSSKHNLKVNGDFQFPARLGFRAVASSLDGVLDQRPAKGRNGRRRCSFAQEYQVFVCYQFLGILRGFIVIVAVVDFEGTIEFMKARNENRRLPGI